MGSMDAKQRWATVVAWGDSHFDVICAKEIAALGVSASQVKSWVRGGRLHRLHDRVWAIGRAAPRRQGWWRAAVLSCSSPTVLSHHSAAAAHGIVCPVVAGVHVTTTGSARTTPGRAVHRCPSLHRDDVTTRWTIPVTTIERTIVDLAGVLTYPDLRAALDQLRHVDLGRLAAARERAGKRFGSAQLAHLVERDEPHTRSELERRFLRSVLARGLARPDHVNTRLGGFEVDFRYDAARLVVEVDGRAYHQRRDQMRTDRGRDGDLLLAGWTPLRLVWEDLGPFETEALDRLARMLARGPAPTGTGPAPSPPPCRSRGNG